MTERPIRIDLPRPATADEPTSFALFDNGREVCIHRVTYRPMTYKGRSLGDQYMEEMTLSEVFDALMEATR